MKITAIHKVTEKGEKNAALALEYDNNLDGASLKGVAFEVTGREVTAVYVNDEGSLDETRKGAKGKFLIIEMDYSGEEAATLPRTWEVKARLDLTVEISQKGNVLYEDGTPVPAWTEAFEVKEIRNEAYEKFTAGHYRDGENGAELVYMLHVPLDYDAKKEYPLVLYWHGGGEKGDNNLKNMLCTLNAVAWVSEEEQRKHPSFVLAPQCPCDGDWIDPDTYETTGVFDAVLRLMFSVLEKYSIDLHRIYCTGFSMGGMGAWESSKRHVDLFAATLVFAGQDNYEGLDILKEHNLWVFNGEDDDKAMPGNFDNLETLESAGVPVNRDYWDGSLRGGEAAEIARKQIARGGNILHTLYREGSIDGRPHEYGWAPAVTNEAVRDWLFSHRKESPSFKPKGTEIPAQFVPVEVDLGFDGNRVKQMSAGNRHTLVLLEDGLVYSWGFNCSGQLGNGESGARSNREIPGEVKGLENIVAVAAGNNFSLALDGKGVLYGWGGNNCGQLGREDSLARFTSPVEIEGISPVREMGCGDNYAVVLKEDGTVWAWGTNINGQLGNDSYKSSIVPVQVLDREDESGFLKDVTGLEVGVRTVIARKKDGTIRCWGDGEYGQIGKGFAMHGPGTTLPFKSLDRDDPSGYLTNVASMAEGRCFTAALKKDGSVHTWGLNRHGELGLGDYKPVPDDSGDVSPDFFTTVVHPRCVDLPGKAKKITAGMNHTLALLDNGTVWSWGYNKIMGSGVLGAGLIDGSSHPVQVKGMPPVRNIFTGFNHNFALCEDGTIRAWGNGSNGRLGPVKGVK